jgi:Rieske Fe-S protein
MAIATLSRRSALGGLVISGCAAVVGYAVTRARHPNTEADGAANAYGAEPTGGQRLAALDQVPAGGGLVLTKRQIVLTRGAGGAVHAFSAVCTHQGCVVSSVTDGGIDCPCHGSRFDASTGAVVTGPATRPLPTIAVVVRGNDVYTS